MNDKEVWKYKLEDSGHVQCLNMPVNAQILTVDVQSVQSNDICIWAEVNPRRGKEVRYFELVGTGIPIPETANVTRHYIGSVQRGPFVWHLYERTEIKRHGV